MANRPNRSRSVTPAKKKTQSEINRIKPAGVLTLDLLNQKSSRVKTINVQFPDQEVYEFYHLPMTVAQAESFFNGVTEEGARLASLKSMLTDQMCNKDGSPFVESDDAWDNVDVQALNSLVEAILGSARSEAGED